VDKEVLTIFEIKKEIEKVPIIVTIKYEVKELAKIETM
jgi:hypothetical protein